MTFSVQLGNPYIDTITLFYEKLDFPPSVRNDQNHINVISSEQSDEKSQ